MQDSTQFFRLYHTDQAFLAKHYPKVYSTIRKALVDHLAPLVEKIVHSRYTGGRCTFCKGDAKVCSERHSHGKSCGLIAGN